MSTKTKIGWLVSIIVAIIGTFGATSVAMNQNQNQSQSQSQQQNQSIVVNINGESVELNQNNAQEVYNDLENDNNELSDEVEQLRKENDELSDQNAQFKKYGTDALVSKEKDFSENKVSLLAFEPVNSNAWKANEGTLKDSLGNIYTVSLAYIIVNHDAYGEYYLNNAYSKLEFKLAPHENMGQEARVQVKVYADDLLVFTSEEISRKSESKTYAVDIKNAKFVKIVCERVESWDNASLLVLDSKLIK